jgi:hypothetical protein
MKNLKNYFCFTGSVETNLYIKYHVCWNVKMNTLPKFENSNVDMLQSQIHGAII